MLYVCAIKFNVMRNLKKIIKFFGNYRKYADGCSGDDGECCAGDSECADRLSCLVSKKFIKIFRFLVTSNL